MADKSIGDLNIAPGSIDDSNTLLVCQQAGAAYKLDGHTFILALTSILDGHGGISSITYTPPVAPSLTGTMVITLADQSTTTVNVENGKGITSISKTSTSGLNDTYTISYNDGTTSNFVVKNGAKGDTGDPWYVWIRYAGRQPTSDADIGTTPDDWIGIYSGTSSTAPTHYTDYVWYEFKGEKGETGDSITSIVKTGGTGAPGTIDTYTAYVESTAIGTFTVYNGSDGQGSPGLQLPMMDGNATAGVANAYAREDHIHPVDTSRASQADMATAQSEIGALKDSILQSGTITINANGSNNYNLSGLTADHVVGNWGMFEDSACTTPIPENAPWADLTITTSSNNGGRFNITVANYGGTAFYMKPTFILKQN